MSILALILNKNDNKCNVNCVTFDVFRLRKKSFPARSADVDAIVLVKQNESYAFRKRAKHTFYSTVFGQTSVKKCIYVLFCFFFDRIMSRGRFCNRSRALDGRGSRLENEKNISRNTTSPANARSISYRSNGRHLPDKSSSRRRQHVWKISCLPRISPLAYIKMYYCNMRSIGGRRTEFGFRRGARTTRSRVPAAAAALGSRRTPPHGPVTDDGVKKLTFRH